MDHSLIIEWGNQKFRVPDLDRILDDEAVVLETDPVQVLTWNSTTYDSKRCRYVPTSLRHSILYRDSPAREGEDAWEYAIRMKLSIATIVGTESG